jgi:outer membrane receptor for ferrienterochelin and colicins
LKRNYWCIILQKSIISQICLLFVLLLSLLCPLVVYGEEKPADLTELSIEELMQVTIETASKYEQKISEAPSSISIITASDIEKYGYRTLADILRSVRGFYSTYDRNYQYLGIRGFARPGDYNSRVLLLLDGVRLNDSIYNTAAIGTEFILDLDLIDRIEIVRGPGSSLYGSNAFFAVINVITKKGERLKGFEVSGDAGSFETYKGRMSYGNKVKENIDMLFSSTYYDSRGDDKLYYKEYDSPDTNNGVAEDSDIDRFQSFFGKVTYNDFTLEGAYVKRKKLIPTACFETVFDSNLTNTIDQSAFIDLKYSHAFPGNWDVLARITYAQYNYDGNYEYDYSEEGDTEPYIVSNKDYSDASWIGGEFQISKTFWGNHRLIAGVEYRDLFRQDQGNYDEEVYLDSEEDSTSWGGFIQDEFTIFSNLILNAGVRHDHYSTFGGTTNPRLSLIYHPFEQTVFKVLYGKAFRAPTAYELFYHDGYMRQKPNPDLDPETIDTYELVVEQQLGENIRATISGYYYKIKDLISLVEDAGDGLLTFENLQEVEAKGIEVELETYLKNGIQGRVSYAYQETEETETGQRLTNSPMHLAKLDLIIPLIQKKVFLGIEEQYTSKRKTLAGNEEDDFFITNVTLFSQDLLKGLKASASVYNLFDKKYSDPGSEEHVQDSIRQDGLTFRVKLTYAF